MSELNDKGYVAERPLPKEKWSEFFKGAPPGRIISNRTIPPGMLMIHNYLDPSWCETLVRECEALEGARHTIGRDAGGAQLEEVVNESRTSEAIGAQALKTDIVGPVRQLYANVAASHYGAQVDWFEQPEILRYSAGAQYLPHADAHNWLREEKKWKRVIDRDLSLLLYLNSEFEGGEVVFHNTDFAIKPSRGMLIIFPSDWRYIHSARPVTSGVRYAIVSWAALKGGPRVNATPPPAAIRM